MKQPTRLRLRRILSALAVAGILSSCSGSASTTLNGVVIEPAPVVATADTTALFRPKPERISLVYFGYTHCPDVCPTTLAAVKRALARLDGPQAERVSVFMVTVDPERDTLPLLKEYLNFFVEGWTPVVLDDPEELRSVADLFGADYGVTKKGSEIEVSHTGSLYAVDSAGQIVVQWPFDPSADADKPILHDLKILLR